MEKEHTSAPVCLTYCSLPYGGRGWPQTCVSILAGFQSSGLAPTMVLPRLRRELPRSITPLCGLRYPMSKMPWHWVSKLAATQTSARFRELLDRSDPCGTIAYFWPGAPPDLIKHARRRGIVTVREMINTFQGTAKRILDDAYRLSGLLPAHGISARDVVEEAEELHLYDYIFAPAPGVEDSLAEAGIPSERILATSYGWAPERFGPTQPHRIPAPMGVRFLFVGIAGVRKGVLELLEAWRRSALTGELVLVGEIEPGVARHLNDALEMSGVRHIPFTSELSAHYANSDVFVFPTHEEGCPQVVMEAAGCGLPVITTAMGAGRLVHHGVNGLLVRPGNVEDLVAAMCRLAGDSELRGRLAIQIHSNAKNFTCGRISTERALTLKGLLAPGQGKTPSSDEPRSLHRAELERRAALPYEYACPRLP